MRKATCNLPKGRVNSALVASTKRKYRVRKGMRSTAVWKAFRGEAGVGG